jgi:peptide/nickel transport system permease protein
MIADQVLADARALKLERGERRRYLVHTLMRSKAFVVGAGIVLFWVVMALAWSTVIPSSGAQSIDALHTLSGPSAAHWFGTDDLGRDVLNRVLAGAAPVLTVAPLATLLSVAAGTLLGLATGYYGGLFDDVAMRVVDALLSFPVIIVAVLVLALLGSSSLNVILTIAILFSPLVTRTVRSAVLQQREREYVAAARMRGERGLYVMLVEILPNVTGPILVEATVRLGYAVFTSATLSFLGLGLQRPSPDWGLTIAIERVFVQIAPWTVLFPALALASLVVGVNLVADTLRQALEE